MLALCDQSQVDVQMLMLMQPGVSEISLWDKLKAGLEVQAGSRLPVLADLVAGARSGKHGWVTGRVCAARGRSGDRQHRAEAGRLLGDFCRTHFVGALSAKLAYIHGIVRDALRRGMDAIRPGVIAWDMDALLRGAIRPE